MMSELNRVEQERIDQILKTGEALPVIRTPGILAHYSNLPVAADNVPVCTWPLDAIEGRVLLHRIINGLSLAIWDMCEKDSCLIQVTHLAACFREYESEDKPGEVISGPLIYLVGPKGTYHTGSEMVFRSLQELAKIEGPPPWNPAVVLQAERVPTRNRRTRIALTLVGRGEMYEMPGSEHDGA